MLRKEPTVDDLVSTTLVTLKGAFDIFLADLLAQNGAPDKVRKYRLGFGFSKTFRTLFR